MIPNPSSPLKVSKLYLKGLLDYLALKQVNLESLQQIYPASKMDDLSGTLDADTFEVLMLEAVRLSQDPFLGLHAGEEVKPGYLGALGYIAMSCATLGEALNRHIEYQNLVSNQGRVELWNERDVVRMMWHGQAESVSRHVVENIFSAWVSFARWISGSQLSPALIEFSHDKPSDIQEYQRVFGCEVQFSKKHNALTIPKPFLEFPLVQADLELKKFYESKARDLIEKQQNQQPDFLQQLRAFMAHSLIQGKLTLEAVATHFDLSPRALQRQLAKCQTSYKTLLDSIRHDLALSYLDDGSTDLLELTFLLGFSDQAAFQRAFKRWTKVTPGQYRKTHGQQVVV